MSIGDVVARVRRWISGPGAEPPAGKHLTVYQSSCSEDDGALYKLVSLEAKAETASRHVQAALAGVGAFFNRASDTISRLFAHIREASPRVAAIARPKLPEPPPHTSLVDVVRESVPLGRPDGLVDIVVTAAPKSSRSPQVGETGEVFMKIRNKPDEKAQVLVTPAAQARPTKIKEKVTVRADTSSSGAPADLVKAALAPEFPGEPIRKKGKIKQLGKQVKSVLLKVKNGVEKKAVSATHKVKKMAAGTADKVALNSLKTPASKQRKVSDN